MPCVYQVQRILKFKVAQQKAASMGLPVPVNTPELEAIGIMSDMLSLMYRYSVDTLGSIISPITIVVLYASSARAVLATPRADNDTRLLCMAGTCSRTSLRLESCTECVPLTSSTL